MMKIPFNKPFLTGKGLDYIQQAIAAAKFQETGAIEKKMVV